MLIEYKSVEHTHSVATAGIVLQKDFFIGKTEFPKQLVYFFFPVLN